MAAPTPAPTVQVDRRDLLAAMDFAASATMRRTPILELANLRAHANGRLTLEGTDLDVVARASIDYTGDHDARLVLPQPRQLRSALIATGGTTVSLSQSDRAPWDKRLVPPSSRLAIVSGAVEATLQTDHPDAFQADDAIAQVDWSATLSATELAQLARIAGAISTDQTRYYLNGVAVRKVADWTWRFQATDGHRLKMVDIPLPDAEGAIPDETILPRQFVNLVLRHFARSREPLRLTYGPKALRNQPDGATLDLSTGAMRVALAGTLGKIDCSLTSKLIDGTYPDVDRVVPRETARWARFKRAELAQAINAINAFSGERIPALRFTFKGDASVDLAIDSPAFGHAGITLDCANTVSGGQMVGFNGAYLIDIVKSFRGEDIVLSWANDVISSGAALFTDPEDTEFRCVLMPMRV